MTESLETLIQQAKELITEIQNHPRMRYLEYSPDVTLGDALQALTELQWELNYKDAEDTNIFRPYEITEDGVTALLSWVTPDNRFIVIINTAIAENYFLLKNNPTLEEAKKITEQLLNKYRGSQ